MKIDVTKTKKTTSDISLNVLVNSFGKKYISQLTAVIEACYTFETSLQNQNININKNQNKNRCWS